MDKILIPWKQNPQTESEKVAFNLINSINFSIQRISDEYTSINDQLNNNGKISSTTIVESMGDSGVVFTAFKSATEEYINKLAVILNTTYGNIVIEDPLVKFNRNLTELTKDGYTDSVLGFKIKGDDRAMKERWSPQVTSVLNMKSLGVPGTTVMTTFDYDDLPIQMTLNEFQEMMMRFTMWFNTQFMTAASL